MARYRIRRQGHRHARIDRRRKIPVTSLLYALGMDGEEILKIFYNIVPYKRAKDGWRVPFDADRMKGYKAINDLVDADSGKVVVEAGRKITVATGASARGEGPQGAPHDRRGIARQLHRRRPREHEDR